MRFLTFLRTIVPSVRLAWRLLREPRVPLLKKAIPLLAVFYVISPFDFLPDVVPILGELDDLFVIAAALQVFVWISPTPAVQFHRKAIADRRPYTPMPLNADFIDV